MAASRTAATPRVPSRGARLFRAFCVERALRYRDFAQRLQPPVSARTVARWAAGTRVPGPAYAAEIERLTDGAVPAASWLPPALAAWLAAHPQPVEGGVPCPEVP